MNRTEKLALECGVEISQPFLDSSYIPVVEDKYIIIDTRSNYASGAYDYWGDVVDLIWDKLQTNKISVFLISKDTNSNMVRNNRWFIGLSKKQESYLVKYAMAVGANDNYLLSVASVFNIPSVGLYSCFSPANTQPVWNKNRHCAIESDRDGNKPSYSRKIETPPTINFISPYRVAKGLLDALGIENQFGDYELIYTGDKHHHKILEIIPDFSPTNEYGKGQVLNLRLDLVSNLDVSIFAKWVTNKKVNLITDKEINPRLLNSFKDSLSGITIILNDTISEAFLKICQKIGIHIKLFCQDAKRLNEFRFKFFDWVVLDDSPKKNSLEDFPLLNSDSFFVSSKILVSKEGRFASKAHFAAKIPVDKNDQKVILSPDFLHELEYFRIYNRGKTGVQSS